MATGRSLNPPHWVYLYKQRHARLLQILEALNRIPGSFITDEGLKRLGIETNSLDFFSGASDSSVTTYFTPRSIDPPKIANIEPTNIIHDGFATAARDPKHNKNKKNKQEKKQQEIPLQRLLEAEFRKHTCSRGYGHGPNYFCLSGWIMRSWSPREETLKSLPLQQHFHTTACGTMIYSRKGHRQVLMVSDECTDPTRITVAELIVLVTGTLGAMQTQKKILFRKSTKSSKMEEHTYHHIFPAQIISFSAPSRARVLCGYFDDKLRVQFTPAKDFDVVNYAWMMDNLLRWAGPTAHGDTTKVVCLPTIPENADLEYEATEEEGGDGDDEDTVEWEEDKEWKDWCRLICVF